MAEVSEVPGETPWFRAQEAKGRHGGGKAITTFVGDEASGTEVIGNQV